MKTNVKICLFLFEKAIKIAKFSGAANSNTNSSLNIISATPTLIAYLQRKMETQTVCYALHISKISRETVVPGIIDVAMW